MAVQDDVRENQMIEILQLKKGIERSGVDASLDFVDETGIEYCAQIELKSTTGRTVSTARDVGIEHIRKWRSRIWIFGFYDTTGEELQSLLCLGPAEMEPWIAKVEKYISPDFIIGELITEKLDIADLFRVCEEKEFYTVEDAKTLFKQQWKNGEYKNNCDAKRGRKKGYSPEKMLMILKQRALYLNRRGSTLNNPHITKSFFGRHADKQLSLGILGVDGCRETIVDLVKKKWIAYQNQ